MANTLRIIQNHDAGFTQWLIEDDKGEPVERGWRGGILSPEDVREEIRLMQLCPWMKMAKDNGFKPT